MATFHFVAHRREILSTAALEKFFLHIVKGKAVPLQVWSDPESSRKLRFPDFMTTAQDGGKVLSLTYRPPLPPRKYTWHSFLLEAESTPGPWCDRKDYVTEKFP